MVCQNVQQDATVAKKLTEGLLNALRLDSAFSNTDEENNVSALRAAFLHAGWSLSG